MAELACAFNDCPVQPEALAGTEWWLGILVPLLPIIAAALVFVFGKRMWRGGALLPIVAIAASLGISLVFLWRTLNGGAPLGWQTEWFRIGSYTFTVGILLDNLSVWLMALVSLLSLLITVFSTHYLHEEPNHHLRRYYAVKGLFVAGMLGTVVADNYLVMFVFWEAMGLCSYLLIGYWYQRQSAAIAAKKAFLVTRLGDILLFLGIILLFTHYQTFNYRELFHAAWAGDRPPELFWAALLIFGGAVGKSAQFPLDIWLPDAMEGPTTVSALIHAATMVKGGVFLVARSFPLFLLAGDNVFLVVGAIGGVTALYTATMALAATDIKRVLAFSTLSQLGYMFLALGAGGILFAHNADPAGFIAAMLHLMNHAFFKALLFLGAGSVILGLHHHQDLREMGGLSRRMPRTHVTMLLASLSIAGIIPLSGFWSKDAVLESAFSAGEHGMPLFALLWFMGILTALLTAFYMFRMMWLAFYGKARSDHAEHAHESPPVMTVPLLILAVFAVVSGLWLVVNLYGGFGHLVTEPLTHYKIAFEVEAPSTVLGAILTSPLTYVSLAVAAAGIWLARRRYHAGLPAGEEATPSRGWRGLLYNRYYVTQAIYEPLGNTVAYGIAKLSAWFDRVGIDGAVNGIARRTDEAGARTRRWQDGRLSTYMASIAIGVAALLVFLHEVVLRVRWSP